MIPQENPSAPTSPSPGDKRPLNWIFVLFFTLTPLISIPFAVVYLMDHGFSWGLLAFFGVCYVISNMSVTCGYHRYFSHRSYNVHPVIEFLYIVIGAGAFQGSILQWSSDHRRHHREVDTDNDPYTIKKGFFFAHMGWLLFKDPHPEARLYPKDLTSKPLVRLQHKYYALFATFAGFILPGLAGWALGFGFWGGVIFGGALRIIASQQSTFLINSAAHTFGRQTYTAKNSARDSFIMAVLTFGEGYHNYHHLFQADYRNGVRWYQFDPTKWWIRSLAFMGLADHLKQTRRDEILKARLAMEERMILARGASAEHVLQLKLKVMEAQTRFRQLRDDYVRAKRNFAHRSREMRQQMRLDIRLAKSEFREAYSQWRRMLRRNTHRVSAA